MNRDFTPITYFLASTWQISAQYPKFADFLLKFPDIPIAILYLFPLIVLLFLRIFNFRSGFFSFHVVSRFSVLTMGFSMLAIEMMILISFQSFFGSLYFQVTSLVTAFMIGMALGTQFANRKMFFGREKDIMILVYNQLGLVVYSTIMYIIFHILNSESVFYNEWFGVFAFSFFALVAGVLGGYQFPLIAELFSRAEPDRNPGVIYAFDLAGAILGALLVSTFLLPAFGIEVTVGLIIWMNVTAIGYNLITKKLFAN